MYLIIGDTVKFLVFTVQGGSKRLCVASVKGIPKQYFYTSVGMDIFDMQAYTEFFSVNLKDRNYYEQELAMALAGLPSAAA